MSDGLMDPAFKDREKKEIRDAEMVLAERRMLQVWSGSDLIGQCPADHPALIRHMDQLERIFDVRIINKSWMLREVMCDA
jgi:hypothetical protein